MAQAIRRGIARWLPLGSNPLPDNGCVASHARSSNHAGLFGIEGPARYQTLHRLGIVSPGNSDGIEQGVGLLQFLMIQFHSKARPLRHAHLAALYPEWLMSQPLAIF